MHMAQFEAKWIHKTHLIPKQNPPWCASSVPMCACFVTALVSSARAVRSSPDLFRNSRLFRLSPRGFSPHSTPLFEEAENGLNEVLQEKLNGDFRVV